MDAKYPHSFIGTGFQLNAIKLIASDNQTVEFGFKLLTINKVTLEITVVSVAGYS